MLRFGAKFFAPQLVCNIANALVLKHRPVSSLSNAIYHSGAQGAIYRRYHDIET